jgi:hypothetical protein
MTLALVQVGVFVRDQLVLTEAARAGAREAAVTTSGDEIRTAVERAAEALDVSAIDMTIERGGGRGSAVAVRLSYPDPVRIPLVGWLFPSAVELSAGATMRQEFE